MAVTEKVFINRTNTNTLTHKTLGVSTSWAGIDHMVIDLHALDDGLSDVQLDTSQVGQENSVDFSVNGFLIFTLGDKSVPAGSYTLELTAVDASGNKTQLMHPDREYTVFQFISTKSVS